MDKRNPDLSWYREMNYMCDNLGLEFACMAGKKLLIVGGAGFLGYYLLKSVLHWNKKTDKSSAIRLTVYDNYTCGRPAWLARQERNLNLVKHDITHPLPRNIGDFQYIIHAASIASPVYYCKYPLETMDANVKGLRFLLEYCKWQKERNQPIEAMLFFSSSEIYGDSSPDNIPTSEDYCGNVSCVGLRACYSESKRYGETLCVNFAQQYDLPIKIVRPFNNYGPGLKITDRRVISDFARDILAERDIAIFSNGLPTRTFCYIADAIIGYYKVLIGGKKGEAYNIGAEEPEISIADLADKVIALAQELFGYKGKVVYQNSWVPDYLVDGTSRRCPLITKAREELGYNPRISLDEGLRRSLIWYKENLE